MPDYNYFEIGRAIRQHKDENDRIAGENKGLEAALRIYGKDLGLPADQIDQYLQPSPDTSARQRNAELKQLLDGAAAMMGQRRAQQQQGNADAELALRQQQEGRVARNAESELALRRNQDARAAQSSALANQVTNQQIAQYAQTQAATARANQYADDRILADAQMQRGVGAGVYSPAFKDDVARYMPTAQAQYRAQGGDLTPQALDAYIRASAKDAPFTPQVIDMGNGRSAMTTSNRSAVPLPKGAEGVMQHFSVGERTYHVGPGNRYFDEAGNAVDFSSDKPMSATDWLMSGQDPAGYKDYREKWRAAMKGVEDYKPAAATGAAGAPAPAGNAPAAAADGAPAKITSEAEFHALPKGARFEYNGKTYVKQ